MPDPPSFPAEHGLSVDGRSDSVAFKIYPVGFVTPGIRTPEIEADDLAASNIESLICSVLAPVTTFDVAAIADLRGTRLGERTAACERAADWTLNARDQPADDEFGRLYHGAQLWLRRAVVTMSRDDFGYAFALAMRAKDLPGLPAMPAVSAGVLLAQVATMRSGICTDLIAGELSALLATRVGAQCDALDLSDPAAALLSLEALLTRVRAALITARRANTIVTNHRRFAEDMQIASTLLSIAPNLAAGDLLEPRPDLVIEMNTLIGQFNWLLHSSDPANRQAELDIAIEASHEAVQDATATGDGYTLSECSRQLASQLTQRDSDSPSTATEVSQLLINGLANSIPLSRPNFELLLTCAQEFATAGHRLENRSYATLGTLIWRTCCDELRARNPALCFAAAVDWARYTEQLVGQRQASGPYLTAVEAGRDLSREPGLGGLVAYWLAQMSEPQSFAVASLAAAGQAVRAIEIAESERSVGHQLSATPDAELAELASSGNSTLAHDYSRAFHAQRSVVEEALDGGGELPWTQLEDITLRLDEATSKLRAARERIRSQPGFASFPRRVPFRDLRDAADEAPLAYIACGPTSGSLLILKTPTDDAPKCVSLPGLQHDAVNERALDLRDSLMDGRDPFASGGWAHQLDDLGEWLWQAAVESLLEATDGAPWIRIIPLGLMGLLPIHIAWTRTQSGRVYALDTTAISYLPSAALRLHARQRPSEDSWRALLVEGAGLDNRTSEQEAQAFLRSFGGAAVLRSHAATADAFISELARCNVAHISAHGFLDDHNPIESGFELAPGTVVRMRALHRLEMLDLDLIVLSSCASAMVSSGTPDETFGFPGLFYGTSAKAVVAAQWPVDQAATAALFDRFYEHWDLSHGLSNIAAALRSAQLAVRDSGLAHPMMWGGFTLTG
jgi:CHAT domain-containing protein